MFDTVKNKVQLSREAQKKWAAKPLEERIAKISKDLKYFETHGDEIAMDITESMGRPIFQSPGELRGFFERANYMCEIAHEALATDVIEDSEHFYRAIEHVPYGVVFVIAAWNFPLLITVNSIVPALIAGNTVLLKHSSLTPKIGEHFEKAFPGLVYNLVIGHATTGRIIEELPINHVVFTGSVSGGKQILQHTAKVLINPGLELGGKDGAFVSAKADLDKAATNTVDGAMFNSGQSCCGIERVYVEKSVHDKFVEKCKALLGDYVLGDPQNEETNLGPLAQAKAADFMLEQIQQAEKMGAKIICGGHDRDIQGQRFLEPTLMVDVQQDMDIIKEENFGPILPIVKVSSLEEAIEKINDSQYGLTSCIFTEDGEEAKFFVKAMDTGTVFQNRCDYLDPALPWTGVKNSGCGSSLSKYGYHGLTRLKSIHFKKG